MNVSKKVRILASLGILSGAVWGATFATFTDQATATSGVFTSGTVDLLLAAETDDDYAFTSFTASNMKPGDVVYSALPVKNNGSLGFTYTMSTSSTNGDGKALNTQLQLGVRKVTGGICDATTYGDLLSESVVTSGALSAVATTSARSLTAGATETLCFKMELPSGVGDTYQGATTTATFTFNATQI